jgi:hypothetical protein
MAEVGRRDARAEVFSKNAANSDQGGGFFNFGAWRGAGLSKK